MGKIDKIIKIIIIVLIMIFIILIMVGCERLLSCQRICKQNNMLLSSYDVGKGCACRTTQGYVSYFPPRVLQ